MESQSGNLAYHLVTPDNLDLALSVQHQIWPQKGVDADYLAKPTHPDDTSNASWLIYQGDQLVGLIGVFNFDADEPGYDDGESIWLDWFAILPEFRGQHFGHEALLDVIEYCRSLGQYKYFRIDTTDTPGRRAITLYDQIMPEKEAYTAEDTPDCSQNYVIYSYSLDGSPIKPWNNHFLDLGNCDEGGVIN